MKLVGFIAVFSLIIGTLALNAIYILPHFENWLNSVLPH